MLMASRCESILTVFLVPFPVFIVPFPFLTPSVVSFLLILILFSFTLLWTLSPEEEWVLPWALFPLKEPVGGVD